MSETYTMILVQETDRAWGVREDEDAEEIIWLPKSQVERGRKRGAAGVREIWEFEIPEWLAIEKRLA